MGIRQEKPRYPPGVTRTEVGTPMNENKHQHHAPVDADKAAASRHQHAHDGCHCGDAENNHRDHNLADDGQGHADHNVHHAAAAAPATDLVKDPVCGMNVDPHTAKNWAEYRGRTYYFCSARCRERFEADPEKYVARET